MRRLNMAMIGGGPGAFIGPIHRIAAELDGRIRLVSGVFSSDPDRSRAAADLYGLDPARCHVDLPSLFAAEAARPDGADFVAIASPNHHHLPAARAALAAGLPVISDKPATATLAEARELAALVAASGLHYAITYTYSGYPLVREARARIAAGELGTIRKLVVEYPQGWLSGAADGKQAAWRVNPALSGPGGCIGDIGTHALQLAEFISGHRVVRLLADLGHVVPGRAVDDDCTVLLRLDNGARGVLLASQIECGERNGLRIRIYGTRGGIIWRQECPNQLVMLDGAGVTRIIHAGSGALGADAMAATRTPAGHPEGYLEAFATLYRDFAAVLNGQPAPLLPGIETAVRGVTFVDTAVAASRAGAGWVDLVV